MLGNRAVPNTFQDVKRHELHIVGERYYVKLRNVDRMIRRGKQDITNQNEVRGNANDLKARGWGTLIVPNTREEIRRFVTA